MAADADQLGNNASTEVVGLLWVVSHVGICRVMYEIIGAAFPTR